MENVRLAQLDKFNNEEAQMIDSIYHMMLHIL